MLQGQRKFSHFGGIYFGGNDRKEKNSDDFAGGHVFGGFLMDDDVMGPQNEFTKETLPQPNQSKIEFPGRTCKKTVRSPSLFCGLGYR